MSERNLRRQLLEGLAEITGPLTTTNLKGYPSFKVDLLAKRAVAEKVRAWLAAALDRMR